MMGQGASGCLSNASVKIAPHASHGTQSPKVAYDAAAISERNILLVGTSGRGKSSTGNLIFGEAKPVFKTSDSMETKPERIDCEKREVDGLTIKICDALTIPDKRLLPKQAKAVIKDRLKKCLTMCHPEGFHFIIFVFSYINRVTPEEHVAFDILLQHFPKEFLMTNAIAVFSHGFDFDLKKTSRNGPDFATWYKTTEDPLLKKISSYMNAVLLYDQPPDQMQEERHIILAAIRKCDLKTTAQSSDNIPSTGEQYEPPKRQRLNMGQSVQEKPENIKVLEKNTLAGATAMKSVIGSAPQGESMTTGEALPDCDVEIFLLGKTGTGKSSTGNTILGYEAFTVDSPTSKTDVGWTERNGVKVKVVDGRGLLDTKHNLLQQLMQMEESVTRGFEHCPNGFHALVLVMRYGTKLTDEEKEILKLLKNMFGNDFTEKHCILVFTDGESFSLKHRNENFIGWCQQDGSDLSFLVKECNNRVVLFYNFKPEKAEESNNQLINFAMGLQERYTKKMFDQSADMRNQFMNTLQGTVNEGNIQNASFLGRFCKTTTNFVSAINNAFKNRFGNENFLQGHNGQQTKTANPADPKQDDLRGGAAPEMVILG